jgi:hypothetical protein
VTINRREFLKQTERTLLASGVALADSRFSIADEPSPSLEIGLGPQLFLDDYLIESMDGLKRVVRSPEPLPKPVLDSKTFGTTQPYMTVLRDPDTKRYRIWYNNKAAVWHAESDDGITWRNPRSVWETSHCFGASVIDDGPSASDPQRRFKIANWQATRIREDKPGDDGGMWIGFSPDGLHWTGYEKNPALPTWPEGYGKIVPHGTQDIIDVFYDPSQKNYIVAVKTPAIAADGFAHTPRAGQSIRRLVGMSTSKDFTNWQQPWRILQPNDQEEGLLEFYGMGGIHKRGGLYIGLVRALHDDLPCDAGGPPNGIGYATLAISRDCRNWHRFREPFLDRNPEPGSWDHAMTWMGCSLPMNEEMFFYYGGYARGHKIAPDSERQLGLARMKRDRYTALASNGQEGKLLTKPFRMPGGRITVNADAAKGEVLIRLLDRNSKPLPSMPEPAAQPIRGDTLAADVRWQQPQKSLRGQIARLEIQARNASIFGLEFHADRA